MIGWICDLLLSGNHGVSTASQLVNGVLVTVLLSSGERHRISLVKWKGTWIFTNLNTKFGFYRIISLAGCHITIMLNEALIFMLFWLTILFQKFVLAHDLQSFLWSCFFIVIFFFTQARYYCGIWLLKNIKLGTIRPATYRIKFGAFSVGTNTVWTKSFKIWQYLLDSFIL